MTKLTEPPITDEEQPTPDEKPKNLRQSMESVFAKLGGDQGFIEWIDSNTANKRIFYRDILPKLVPKQVEATHSAPDGGPMRFIWEGGLNDPAKLTEKDVDVSQSAVASVAQSLALEDDD